MGWFSNLFKNLFKGNLATEAGDRFNDYQNWYTKLDPQVKAEWCVGEVWGAKYHGDLMDHAVSLNGLDIDGVPELWFMEPQPIRNIDGSVNFRIWKADPISDQIQFFKL